MPRLPLVVTDVERPVTIFAGQAGTWVVAGSTLARIPRDQGPRAWLARPDTGMACRMFGTFFSLPGDWRLQGRREGRLDIDQAEDHARQIDLRSGSFLVMSECTG
jgi:hypothetical protein